MPVRDLLELLRRQGEALGPNSWNGTRRRWVTRVERTWAGIGLSGWPIIGRRNVLRLLTDSGDTPISQKSLKSRTITPLLTRRGQSNRPKPVDFRVEIVGYLKVNAPKCDNSRE